MRSCDLWRPVDSFVSADGAPQICIHLQSHSAGQHERAPCGGGTWTAWRARAPRNAFLGRVRRGARPGEHRCGMGRPPSEPPTAARGNALRYCHGEGPDNESQLRKHPPTRPHRPPYDVGTALQHSHVRVVVAVGGGGGGGYVEKQRPCKANDGVRAPSLPGWRCRAAVGGVPMAHRA